MAHHFKVLATMLLACLAPGALALTARTAVAEKAQVQAGAASKSEMLGLSELTAPYTEVWRGLQQMVGEAHGNNRSFSATGDLPSVVSLLQKVSNDVEKVSNDEEPHLTRHWNNQPTTIVRSQSWLELLAEFASFVVFYTLCALVYYYTRTEGPDEERMDEQRHLKEFEYTLFDTRKCDLDLVLCSACCVCIRWTATMSTASLGLLTFWPTFFLFTCLKGLGFVHLTLWVASLALVIYFRQKLRAHYGMNHGTCGTYCEDCCVWFWCSCCAAAQEAKQVEYVRKANAANAADAANAA